jgi:hypothetical protein
MFNNMKNKFFFSSLTIIIVISLALSSCKKYLELSPVSSFDPGFVFSNIPNAQKALIGVYQDLTGDNGYGIRVSMYYPYDNDEMIGIHQIGDGDRGDIAHFTLNAGNLQLNNPWNQMYAGIERANQCIYYIPNMDMYNNGTSVQKGELQRLYGEALTLRAQFYLELIRNWGDVPAQWLPSSLQTDLFIGKTNRDTIYNHLLDDLKLAETLVPWRTEIAALGDPRDERITKGAVKGLRARIALYRGGYSLRSASSMYGQIMARPSDYKTYYQIAKDECSDLMARRDQHTLNSGFQSLFKDNIDAHIIDPSGEVMFEVAMAGGSGSYDSKLGYYDGPKVTAAVTTNAAIGVLSTYFYLFDSTDNRRDVTCAPYEVKADFTLTGHPATTIAEAKFRKDWITNPTVFTSSAQYNGINWPILRFSDVLLMYAEADNELNGSPSASAIAAITEVSKRGHSGNAALVPVFPTDHDGFFNAVVKERSLEFGGEGIRKYDLIRWNLIAQRIADAKTNIKNLSTRTGTFVGNYSFNNFNFSQAPDSVFYKTTSTTSTGIIWGTSFYKARTISSISGYSKIVWVNSAVANVLNQSGSSSGYAFGFLPNHSELLPIPQAAIDANFNLKQEYGY